MIGDRAPVEVRGTAFGLYHMVSGLAALPGALLFGVIWQMAGSQIAFAVAAMASALALLAFLGMARRV